MKETYSAWNPGLESEIPAVYRSLETIHRPENVTSLMTDIDEIAQQTGLNAQELVVFRPERLALHELVIRVTADIVVLEGSDEIELGRNFRHIAGVILNRYIQPHMVELKQDYKQLREAVYARIDREMRELLFYPQRPELPKRRFFPFLPRRVKRTPSTARETISEREHRAISMLKEKGVAAKDPLSSAIYRNLHHVLAVIVGNRGYLGPDRAFLVTLACNRVCNSYGSRRLGEKIAPLVESAIEKEGYTRITHTDSPLLISLKGASAAGKSSLRPMLKQMMSEYGIQSGGYAIISPDIWRRLLLDYDALGEAYKYAGRLTSHELIIIDRKLDHYIRDQADRLGALPHLLVDRFRFDSFSTEQITKILHATYVKHVNTLAMYFVVTPPHTTVERGWERGLQTGRYKAVEDFLDHSVEAYVGMPKILFKWLAYDFPLFKYEFLDNSVPKGTFPKRTAFGTQSELNILDCSVFINIERYQKINIRARRPDDVYPPASVMSVENNIGFLKQCIKKIPKVNFIDRATGTAYLTTQNGVFTIVERRILAEKLLDAEWARIFAGLAPHLAANRLHSAEAEPASKDYR
ncbi:MAG: hypothetical protein KDI18_09560 [Gammaproteobacteria bacterium]|nr:hypothetical protein [Gammaproteobacteria bacterium]